MKYVKIVLVLALFVPIIASMPGWLAIGFAAMLGMALFARPKKLPWYMNLNGGVAITLANGQLGGLLQTNDGITGYVMTGVTEGGGYTVGTPILVSGLASVAQAGITVANNPFALKELTEFYNEAGDGTLLYLMLVPNTMTVAQMADNTNANGATKLLNFAIAGGLPIKVLGIQSDDLAIHNASGTVTITNGFNAAVAQAASNMAIMAAAYFAQQAPFRCIIGASSYAGTASVLTNFTSGTTNNRTAILIGDTVSHDATYSAAAVGLLLGRIASIPVQRKISRVKDGALTNTTAYLHTTAFASAGADPATIASKGYITFTTYPNVSGFFFSGDPMLTVTTDDYCMLARGRVIDKAHILAYTIYVQETDDEVPVDDSGNIEPAFAKWLEQQVINQVQLIMVNNGECSAVDCYINPVQNIISTNTLNVVLKIRPVGYSTYIVVNLGFEK